MNLVRQEFPTHCEELAFSLLVPDGFETSELPDVEPDFIDPHQARPLALLASPEFEALLAVAWRPGFHKGSVTDWLADLVEHFRIEVTGALSGFVGGDEHRHPAMFVEGRPRGSAGPQRILITALEDDGSFFTVHARGPEAAWNQILGALRTAAASIELRRPLGPTVPCVPNGPIPVLDMPGVEIGEWPHGRGTLREPDATDAWADAVGQARERINAGRFDEAEGGLQRVDRRSMAASELARLYESRLRELAAAPKAKRDRVGLEALFGRALRWGCCWPDPHTEIEAEQAAEAAREIRGRLIGILGHDPGSR